MSECNAPAGRQPDVESLHVVAHLYSTKIPSKRTTATHTTYTFTRHQIEKH